MTDLVLASKFVRRIYVVKNYSKGRASCVCGWLEDHMPRVVADAVETTLLDIKRTYDKRIGFRPIYTVSNGVIYRDYEFGDPGTAVPKGMPHVFKVSKDKLKVTKSVDTDYFYKYKIEYDDIERVVRFDLLVTYKFNDGKKDVEINEVEKREYSYPPEFTEFNFNLKFMVDRMIGEELVLSNAK